MRYSINYSGAFFVGDNENYNTHYYDCFKKARNDLYALIAAGVDEHAYLKDEEYQCSLHWDDKAQEFYWEG